MSLRKLLIAMQGQVSARKEEVKETSSNTSSQWLSHPTSNATSPSQEEKKQEEQIHAITRETLRPF